jgi:hypothetical protein
MRRNTQIVIINVLPNTCICAVHTKVYSASRSVNRFYVLCSLHILYKVRWGALWQEPSYIGLEKVEPHSAESGAEQVKSQIGEKERLGLYISFFIGL